MVGIAAQIVFFFHDDSEGAEVGSIA